MEIKERFKELVKKLLSFKFVIFIIAVVLLCFRVITGGEWLTVTGIVLGTREGVKLCERLRGMNEGNEGL